MTGAADAAAGVTAGSWIGRWWPWIVAIVILLFLLARCMAREEPAAPAAAPPPPAAMAPAPAPGSAIPASIATALPAKVYFDVGKTTLSDDGKSAVKAIAELVKKDGGKVDVTGYADASGDPAQNQEIAKHRAMAVRDALQADGVDASDINMKPPASVTGSGGDAQARRVEVSKAS
jgi:outer membrane protein OmpA-like peptidoglycan-associated protein